MLKFSVHQRKLLWMYCPGHARMEGIDRLAGITNVTSGLGLGRSEVLRSLRHYLRARSQGHHTFDRLEERGMKRGSIRRSLYLFPRQRWGKLLRDGVDLIWIFRTHRCHLEQDCGIRGPCLTASFSSFSISNHQQCCQCHVHFL